jgi:hypothetical protein
MDDVEVQEYFVLEKAISDFDQRLLTIKRWGVTLSLAALGFGFQIQQRVFQKLLVADSRMRIVHRAEHDRTSAPDYILPGRLRARSAMCGNHVLEIRRSSRKSTISVMADGRTGQRTVLKAVLTTLVAEFAAASIRRWFRSSV